MTPQNETKPRPRPNLFAHQVILALQEVASAKYQGPQGFEHLVEAMDDALRLLGSDVSSARVETFRKLYHTGFNHLVRTIAQSEDVELMVERFRELVF